MYTDILTDLIITKILYINTIYNEGNTRIKKMQRTKWAIVQKYEGETEYYINGKTILSNKNNMVILPKGTNYDWLCTKSGHYSIIEFDCDKTHNELLSFPISEQLSEKILKTIKELEYKRTLKAPFFEIESLRDTYDIILKLASSQAKEYRPSSLQSKIKNAEDYIAKNYSKNITNDDLAAMCNISTVYFRKIFTQVYGISPISYIHSIRIKKAKEMLNMDYSSITNVALSLGYADIYDFSRTFKKYVGVSPKRFAEESRNTQY